MLCAGGCLTYMPCPPSKVCVFAWPVSAIFFLLIFCAPLYGLLPVTIRVR